MILKRHVCGVGIVYDINPTLKDKKIRLDSLPSRENGSLYARQKRSIADATEYLRLRFNKGDRRPLIFCLTSPGFISLANTPKFVSCFIENMRANYGMGEYVWVREMTRKGYPHFHFIAEWNNAKYFFDDGAAVLKKITAYWSGLFESTSTNSVRLGSYHPITKKRTLYVTHPKQCWYLTKYIGKSIGDRQGGIYNGLEPGESGWPQMHFKKSIRSFAISEALREWSGPTMFDEVYIDTATGEVIRSCEGFRLAQGLERRWQCKASGLLLELGKDDLHAYRWKWTGHGQTYIGYRKDLGRGAISPIASPGMALPQKRTENRLRDDSKST